ncbi:MAG: substrate-binding domain-containing protein, partial [Alphaproteobacteria bacterium]|nr:substrate-binding domain-containing protein [Alphaproteobacteria bacterium]
MITRVAACITLVLAMLLTQSVAYARDPVRVFAAASLTEPLTQLFAQQEGVDGVFGSSGTLARQIEGWAPADIFISANPKWSQYLMEK